jgi:hypothetical protein
MLRSPYDTGLGGIFFESIMLIEKRVEDLMEVVVELSKSCKLSMVAKRFETLEELYRQGVKAHFRLR